jgi:hypothetical protein
MRKMMVLIIVLVVAAVSQGAITPVINANIPIDNIAQIQSFDKTLFVKCADGSAYIVYLDAGKDASKNISTAYDICLLSGGNISIPEKGRTITKGSILDLLPKSTTIISLGIGGFLIRHKKRVLLKDLPLYI